MVSWSGGFRAFGRAAVRVVERARVLSIMLPITGRDDFMKRFTSKTKEAAKVLLRTKTFSEAEVASLLSVQLRNIRQLVNEQGDKHHGSR